MGNIIIIIFIIIFYEQQHSNTNLRKLHHYRSYKTLHSVCRLYVFNNTLKLMAMENSTHFPRVILPDLASTDGMRGSAIAGLLKWDATEAPKYCHDLMKLSRLSWDYSSWQLLGYYVRSPSRKLQRCFPEPKQLQTILDCTVSSYTLFIGLLPVMQTLVLFSVCVVT